MRPLLVIFALLAALSARAQQSAFNTILLSKPNAQADRDYLGIFPTNIPGLGPYVQHIATNSGGGGWSYDPITRTIWYNSSFGRVYLGNGIGTNELTVLWYDGSSYWGGPMTNQVPAGLTNLTLAGWDQVAIRFAFTNPGASSDLVYNFEGFTFGDDVRTPGGFFAGNGFYGDAEFLTNFPGLSITQSLLLVSGGATNLYTNVFNHGLLIASGKSGAAAHGPSLLLEGGGYILLEGGGTILKE